MIKLHVTVTCDELGCEEFDVLALPEPECGDNDIPAILEAAGWQRMSDGYVCEDCLAKRYREARQYQAEVAAQVFERNR